MRILRPSPNAGPADILFMGYVAFTGLLLLLWGWQLESPGLWVGLVALHAGVLAVSAWWSARSPDPESLPGLLREIYPLLFISALYFELRYLALFFADGFHDPTVLAAEEWLFGEQLALTLSERLPYMWLSELLHFFYAFYWVLLPVAVALFYLRGRTEGIRELIWSLLLIFFVCYFFFIFWPVQGPYYEFPHMGAPWSEGFWYGIVHAVLADGGSRGAAFPSSHVAVAVTVVLVAWRHDRLAFWLLWVPVAGLVVSTVYGRFHYAVDALAGIAAAVVVFPAGLWLWRRWRAARRPGDQSTKMI